MKNLFLLFYNFFEDHIHLPRIKKFLNNNVILDRPIIIDIGSHKGKFIKLFNDLYKNATIFCFEPNNTLNKNLKDLEKNIKIFNFALGDKLEKKKLYFNNLDLTSTFKDYNKSSLYYKFKQIILRKKNKDEYKDVQVTTLDYFCDEHKINKIEILKIDVEGTEYSVLKGGSQILENVKFLIIEIQNNELYKDYSKNIIEDFLEKKNFQLIQIYKFPFMFFEDRIYKKR